MSEDKLADLRLRRELADVDKDELVGKL